MLEERPRTEWHLVCVGKPGTVTSSQRHYFRSAASGVGGGGPARVLGEGDASRGQQTQHTTSDMTLTQPGTGVRQTAASAWVAGTPPPHPYEVRKHCSA